MAKVKKTLALEIISFKHPQTNETALVGSTLCPDAPCELESTARPTRKPLEEAPFIPTHPLSQRTVDIRKNPQTNETALVDTSLYPIALLELDGKVCVTARFLDFSICCIDMI